MGQPVMYWQILSKQPAKLAEFYSSIFGWNIWPPDALGSRAVETGSEEGIPGGIWPIPQEAHSMVQLFILVDDLGAYVEKIEAGGGRIIFPPQTLPSGDTVSILLDPEGIPFGIFRKGKSA
jgi:predicted enzyme related to lactoylglutathione lyase